MQKNSPYVFLSLIILLIAGCIAYLLFGYDFRKTMIVLVIVSLCLSFFRMILRLMSLKK